MSIVVDPIVIGKIKLSTSRIVRGERLFLYGFTDSTNGTRYISDCSVGPDPIILPKGGFLEIVAENVSVDETCIDEMIPIHVAGPTTKVVSRDTRLDLHRLSETIYLPECIPPTDCIIVPRGIERIPSNYASPDSALRVVRGSRFPFLVPVSEWNESSYLCPLSQTPMTLPLQIHNPHHEIIPTSPADALIVFDHLDYYHYGIDGFNDTGWGCAYRSIQTILSWIYYNCAKNISKIPSIPEIQSRLQNIDYAHSNLKVGTAVWIGCVEAAAVIGDVTDGKVACRILHAQNIHQLEAFILNEVRTHFITNGSPVMVGAGDYAFVIAGVSASTNQVLILDPHCQQPSTALQKGYIGWKSIRKHFDFKKTNASGGFMNILVPVVIS